MEKITDMAENNELRQTTYPGNQNGVCRSFCLFISLARRKFTISKNGPRYAIELFLAVG